MIQKRNLRRFLLKTFRQPGYALGVARKRALAYLMYLGGSGRSFLPESLTLFLTHRCNLQCKMCGQWGEAGVTRKNPAGASDKELSLETYRRLLEEIGPYKPNITLFGGEPLLYPHAVELIERIKRKKMHCLMITNGALLSGCAQKLVESGLDELNVSLDGDRSVHDGIRGMPGLFEKIMAGLQAIAEHKSRLGLARPLVHLQCTINSGNCMYLDAMPAVAKRAGADALTFHHLIHLDRSELEAQERLCAQLGCSGAGWQGFVFGHGIDTAVLKEQLGRASAQAVGPAIDVYPISGNYFEYNSYGSYCNYCKSIGARCLSPWIAGYLFPGGELRPCLNLDYSFGNIGEQSLRAAWNSPSARRFRKFLKAQRLFPACARCTELYRY